MKSTWDNIKEIEPRIIKDCHVGFVYTIVEKDTGMIYYGIKKLFKVIKYPPLKGRKNKRHKVKETDWRTYKTSSPIMQKKLEDNPGNYICQIIKLCDSVTEMKAYEAYYQLTHYVEGDWQKLYNEVINLRLRIR
jgi:hypothetical protein